MSEVFERVKAILAEELEIEESSIDMESSIVDDLGADSLNTVNIIMRLEEFYHIEIPDEDAEKMQTVGDVVEFVESRIE